MIGRSAPTNALPGIGIGLLLLIGPLQIGAEQLITRTFTQEDGLPDTAGMREVMQDSHGFIWIATHLGVSRFDGQQFQNYSLKDGLGYPQANRILETRSGEIWVSTNGAGVARYDPRSSAPRRFASYPTGTTPESNAVNSLHEGADGTLWASTDWGLYALKKGDTAFHLEFLPPRPPGTSSSIQAIIDAYSDGPDALWIASGYQGLYRRHADGSLDHWTDEGGGTFFHDRSGQLWLVTYHGALAIDRNARPGRSPVIRRLEAPTGAGGCPFWRMIQDRRGSYWMSSPCGLVRFDGTGSRVFGAREGLPGIDTSGLAEDRAGNLWVGVKGAGVVRIVRDRVTAWSLRDGLAKPNVLQIVPRTGGGVAVVAEDETGVQVQELTGESFRNSTPPVRMLYPANHPALVDRSGDSWVATQGGVVRFRGGRRIHVYGATEGWPVGSETALYEDRAGDIWILHWGSPSYIGRWKRREKRVESLGAGGPADGDPFVLTEDAGGSIWVGCLRTGLFRWRAGTFVHVPSPFPPRAALRSTAYAWIHPGGSGWDTRKVVLRRYWSQTDCSRTSGESILQAIFHRV